MQVAASRGTSIDSWRVFGGAIEARESSVAGALLICKDVEFPVRTCVPVWLVRKLGTQTYSSTVNTGHPKS